jgi:probable F420-dependent oxidoreductase
MRLNTIFPTRDIGNDPAKIRDWAQAAEDLGYAYIEVPDHVLGAAARDGWTPVYSEKDPFHETFVTLGFLAAVTKAIRLSSGVLIAPQRQTAVIAKQAAQVDLLSEGRLRLGVGVGWNHVEYEALGVDWKQRGALQAEQIEVMRRLWCEALVSFSGKFHQLREVSIVPAPVQRPIPIWLGGSSEATIRRAARLADGWMPILSPDAQAEQKLALLDEELRRHGRDRAGFGLEPWVRAHDPDTDRLARSVQAWRRLGADMVMVYPVYRVDRFDDLILTLQRFREVAEG